MTNYHKGVLLVLSTALISGGSIFVNKFGVSGIAPTLFAGLKNLAVGLVIVGLILVFRRWREVFSLKTGQWFKLFLVGLVGGSVPFILFFNGLANTSGAKAGFIHKTLFVYVALLAVIFLKEKLTSKILIGLIALFVGQLLFLGIKPQALNFGDLLVFSATLFWAAEIVLAKKLLQDLSANIVAAARMVFGGGIIWAYLFITGQASLVFGLGSSQWGWVAVTGLFLVGYVLTFYHGLKKVPAYEATAILAIGAPVTLLLSAVWAGAAVSVLQVVGMVIMFGSLFGLIKLLKPKGNYVFASNN